MESIIFHPKKWGKFLLLEKLFYFCNCLFRFLSVFPKKILNRLFVIYINCVQFSYELLIFYINRKRFPHSFLNNLFLHMLRHWDCLSYLFSEMPNPIFEARNRKSVRIKQTTSF